MGIAIQFADGGNGERLGNGILDLNLKKIKPVKINGKSMADLYAEQIMEFAGELQPTEEELSEKLWDKVIKGY